MYDWFWLAKFPDYDARKIAMAKDFEYWLENTQLTLQ